jgi:hypothetical protein
LSRYAVHIQNLKLYKELENSFGRDGLNDSDVSILKGIVNNVAEHVGPRLDRIRLTFPEYTEHDIKHSRNIIDLLGRFIPAETVAKLNALELALLLLSALLHDAGMIVSDHEKHELLKNPDFISFCERQNAKHRLCERDTERGNVVRARVIEDGLLAEYIRSVHPERSGDYITSEVQHKLVFQEVDLSQDTAKLCESHGWGIKESLDIQNPDKSVHRIRTKNPINGTPVNLQYLACCLRLADIMDFDRSRTPASVFEQIDFTDEKSWKEWNRHLQVRGWTVEEKEVAYSASCTHPAFYVAVHEFIGSVDRELTECRYLLDDAPAKIAKRYRLYLPHIVDRRLIKMRDKKYVAGDFRFQLEYEEIMKLLMDKTLYPDASIFLRELLQNSLDACRHMKGLYRDKDLRNYRSRIVVWDQSDDVDNRRIVVQDNGVGMSLNIIKNFFVPIGKSYYRSMEFNAERERLAKKGIQIDTCSYFGIGILSSFLVADKFDVETYRYGHEPLRVRIEGQNKCFVIERLNEPKWDFFKPQAESEEEDGPPNRPGTRVTVHLRDDATIDVFQILKTFAVNVEYDIRVHRPGKKRLSIVHNRTWEPKAFSVERNIGGIDDLSPEVRNVVGEIIVASHIPFKNWTFSKHLAGDAWFWFLRGHDGKPCPRKDFLRIDCRLQLCGAAGITRRLTSLFRLLNKEGFDTSYFRGKWISFAEQYVNVSCEGLGGYLAQSYAKLWKRQKLPYLRSSELKKATSAFLWMEQREKWDVLQVVKNAHLGNAVTPWMQIGEAWQNLYDRSLQWKGISHTDFRAFKEVDEFSEKLSTTKLGMRGILLPAGITNWRPLDGTSESLTNLMPFLGGIQLDLRSDVSPVPTCSRLSIPLERATEFLHVFARAALRHAADLVEANDRGNNWIQWFRESLLPVVQEKEWLRRNRFEPSVCLAWKEAYRQMWDYIRYQVGPVPEIDDAL